MNKFFGINEILPKPVMKIVGTSIAKSTNSFFPKVDSKPISDPCVTDPWKL